MEKKWNNVRSTLRHFFGGVGLILWHNRLNPLTEHARGHPLCFLVPCLGNQWMVAQTLELLPPGGRLARSPKFPVLVLTGELEDETYLSLHHSLSLKYLIFFYLFQICFPPWCLSRRFSMEWPTLKSAL